MLVEELQFPLARDKENVLQFSKQKLSSKLREWDLLSKCSTLGKGLGRGPDTRILKAIFTNLDKSISTDTVN